MSSPYVRKYSRLLDLYEGERLFETFGNNKQKMVIVVKLVDEMIQGKYSKEKGLKT